jgi:hypothetical protein
MKFPSIFRTSSPMRFDIKPRYYDPVKEEIEQRTSRIKKEIEFDSQPFSEEQRIASFQTGIRGSFAQSRGIKQRDSNAFSSTAMIRTLIFLVLMGGTFGYIYFGSAVLTYGLYVVIFIAAVYFFFRLKSKAGR